MDPSPLRTPRARPIKLGGIRGLFQPGKRRQHAAYAAAVRASKTQLLQSVASAATQFADAKLLGMPLGPYAARLERAQRHAQ